MRCRAPIAVAAAALACAAAAPADDAAGSWTTYGDGAARLGDAPAAPTSLERSFVLPLPGRITGQVLADDGDFFAATTAGEVVAFDADGAVLWRRELGQLTQRCQQLDGYGVVGTGVIDDASQTLYVADAFGRLHALDLATGAERAGWPVRVFADDRRELVWGALTLAEGAVYVPTASYCDSPSLGGVYRVDTQTLQVSSWVSVPADEGGGGGVWGWGGTAYSDADDALYAVTANAFSGGTNTGDAFTESAGYGEHLVKLAPDLSVEDSSHPDDLTQPADLDFVGSPVVFDRSGCGELVVGADKDDEVYAWHADDVGSGPVWSLQLERFDSADPLLTQLAWSSSLDSLYAVTGTSLDRIAVGADCSAKVEWREPLGTQTENGSPTVSGDDVWFAVNGTPQLVAYDGRTGAKVFDSPLGGTTVEAPTIVDGRILVGTMTGFVDAFGDGPATPAATRTLATSYAGRYGWQSRTNGVFATADHGRSWHLVYPSPALDVARLSRTTGAISLGTAPGPCMCATRQLVTHDAGQTWRVTDSLPEDFVASAGRIYFWQGGRLGMLGSLGRSTASTHLASSTLANVPDGTIVDVKPIPDGVAALVSSRVRGQGWDTAPRLLLVRGTQTQTITLPTHPGRPLVQQLAVSWPKLTVTGEDDVADPARAAVWTSPDGGATWAEI